VRCGITFPYESQWGDPNCNRLVIEGGIRAASIRDWASDGYDSSAQYDFWSRRVCGLACLRSVLRGWYDDSPPMGSLLQEAIAAGAYLVNEAGVKGLIYRPFLRWVEDRFGISGAVMEGVPTETLLSSIQDGTVVLASVSSEIRNPSLTNQRRGGHLVLAYRYNLQQVTFHNPSGVGATAAAATLPLARFSAFHAGRGIILRRRP